MPKRTIMRNLEKRDMITLTIWAFLLIVCLPLSACVALLWWLSTRHQLRMRYARSRADLMVQEAQREAQVKLEQERTSLHATYQQVLTQQGQILSSGQSEAHGLVDKAMALVAASDVISFQQMQVMNPSSQYDAPDGFDPSDEAEIKRIRERGDKRLASEDEEQEKADGSNEQFVTEFGLEDGFNYTGI